MLQSLTQQCRLYYMTTWFSSDFHISHKLVAGLRGFWRVDQDGVKVPDTELHDLTLADNWDAVVQPEDTVYLLGDMSINSGPQVIEWIKDRPGTKRLISGNHDRSHTAIFHKQAKAKIAEWSPYFESILDEDTIKIAGRKVTLSHFPSWEWGDGARAAADGYVSRYEQFRPWVHAGKTIILHGHTHDIETAHGREYHVGLDAHNLQLVPESTIVEWLATVPER